MKLNGFYWHPLVSCKLSIPSIQHLLKQELCSLESRIQLGICNFNCQPNNTRESAEMGIQWSNAHRYSKLKKRPTLQRITEEFTEINSVNHPNETHFLQSLHARWKKTSIMLSLSLTIQPIWEHKTIDKTRKVVREPVWNKHPFLNLKANGNAKRSPIEKCTPGVRRFVSQKNKTIPPKLNSTQMRSASINTQNSPKTKI